METIVIGGGATGLATAYFLARDGVDVTVVEAAPQPGGLLSTFDVGSGDRLEYFYHHFFTHDEEIRWLLDELDLTDRVLFEPTTMGMYRDGTAHPFDGPADVLRFSAISVPARLRFGLSAALLTYVPGYEAEEEQAALPWFYRWAGDEATEAIWRPMLEIKFGDAAPQVPLSWMVGRLRQRARSREGTTEKLGYLRGSLQVLVDALIDALEDQGVEIRVETPVESFKTDGSRVTGVQTPDATLSADAVVSTLPTPILSTLIRDHDSAFADQLDSIDYMGAICTILAFDRSISPVYWLNVADPGYDFGGVIEQTHLVPPSHYDGMHLVYLSRYVHWDHPLWTMNDEELLDRQVSQLTRLLPAVNDAEILQSWVFRGQYAAPVTDLGFYQRIPSFDTPVDGLYMASMPHIYPDERSTNNSIRIAAAVVEEMGRDVNDVPEGTSLAATYGYRPPDTRSPR